MVVRIGVENGKVGLDRRMVLGVFSELRLAVRLEAVYLLPLGWIDVRQFVGSGSYNRAVFLVQFQ